MFRIVTFDGGGIKGLLTSQLLKLVEAEVPGFLNNVDLFAGTSTGGIIAAGMAHGYTPSEMYNLYYDNRDSIFIPYPEGLLGALERGITAPKYTNTDLEKTLKKYFGDGLLSGLKKKVIIPSFQLDFNGMWRPVFFTNYEGSSHKTNPVVDVLLRTSAAPTYFPSHQGCIDGGVISNNPSIPATAAALDSERGGTKLEEIRLFSFGTGKNPQFIKGGNEAWGALEWLNPAGDPPTPLLSILIEGVMTANDYECRQILSEARYRRINPVLDKPYNLDDVKNVDQLIDAANNYPKKNPKEWEDIIKWATENFK